MTYGTAMSIKFEFFDSNKHYNSFSNFLDAISGSSSFFPGNLIMCFEVI